jgi:flagellar biosynthesis GTPase FlhF
MRAGEPACATDSNGDGETGEHESHGWMHDHWRGATQRVSRVRHTVRESGTSAALEDARREPAEKQLYTFATPGLPTPHAQEEEEEEEEKEEEEEEEKEEEEEEEEKEERANPEAAEERANPEEAEERANPEEAEEKADPEEAEEPEEPEDVDGGAVAEDDDNLRILSQVVQETVPMDPAPPPPVAEDPVAEEEGVQSMNGALRLVSLQTPPKCAHDAHGAPYLWSVH